MTMLILCTIKNNVLLDTTYLMKEYGCMEFKKKSQVFTIILKRKSTRQNYKTYLFLSVYFLDAQVCSDCGSVYA